MPVLITLALALGYDRITAVGIIMVGYGVGYGAALINPFTVLLAQDIAGLQPASGLWYRMVLLAVFLPIGIHHVWSYAKKVGRDPAASLVADVSGPEGVAISSGRDGEAGADHPPMTTTHKLVLAAVGIALVLLVYGLSQWHWYLVEMGAVFVALTVVMAIIARVSPDRTAVEFGVGAASLTSVALMIGVARGIQVVSGRGRHRGHAGLRHQPSSQGAPWGPFRRGDVFRSEPRQLFHPLGKQVRPMSPCRSWRPWRTSWV